MDIICPNCHKVFDLSEEASADVRQQIRNAEFEKELQSRAGLVEKSLNAEFQLKLNEMLSEERETARRAVEEQQTKFRQLQSDFDREVLEAQLREKELRFDLTAEYSDKITKLESEKKAVEYERDYYKDLKTRMSTKMIGETLEQHCEMEFNRIRMTAFPKAQFDKDNIVSKASGSKGDYIFREFDENGVELISIMFEMKNEMDETKTKHKNEDFFKELDKDRNEKKCEYAVLVSMLEADSEFYNQGIVDVSYRYPKMYVIRPQFFIPMISLLRNASLKALDERRELIRLQNQNIDIKNFEDSLEQFKTAFAYNYNQANKRFVEAIDEIDKTIDHLNKVKAALMASDRQLRLANDKASDVTLKRLAKNSPSIQKMSGGKP